VDGKWPFNNALTYRPTHVRAATPQLLVFLALTLSAELYFAPAVGNIARWLALSEDVAGATLLAFGNGAPDFFTQVAALTYGDDVDLPLALGEGIGAGLYVSCFCLGCALLTGPPTGVVVPLLPFVRDAVTYLGALLMVMGAAKDNIVTGGEAAVMLAWYALYVCAVLQGERIARFLPARWSAVHSTPVGVGSGLPHARISEVELAAPAPANRLEGGPGEEHVASLTHSAKRHGTPHAVSATEEPPLPLSLPPGHDEESPSGTLSHLPAPSEAPLAGTPRQQVHAWALRYSGLRDPEASRALLPLSVPVRLLIACTMADPDSGTVLPLHVALIALCLPSFLLFAGGVGVFAVHSTGLALLAFARVALACAALSLLPARGIDARTSYAVSACAFLGGLAWMDVCADEIVAIFQTLGRILGFPETLLGGTIMCWAASMGDLFSMLAVVRCGFLQMAVTSCFAGPLFQLLCGLGVSLLFINVKAGGGPVEMRFGTELRVMLAFGVVALCYYAVGVPTLHRCHLTRRFGWGVLSAYVAFIVVYSAAGLESYNGG